MNACASCDGTGRWLFEDGWTASQCPTCAGSGRQMENEMTDRRAPQPPAITGREPEAVLFSEIAAELHRARTKFPGKNVTFAALVEEVGELAKATFEEPRANVRKEAVQVAVMAMRMVLDGDQTFDAWRAGKGLDALIAALDEGGES